jgi:hypothetical protein
MKKTLFSLVFALLVFAVPAFAQGRHGGGGGSHGGNGGGNKGGDRHAQSQPRHDDRGRGIVRDDHINGRRAEREFHGRNDYERHPDDRGSREARGYHYSNHDRGEFRRHWDGRRFDHEFFESHWGERHRFYWNHCGWYGPRFYVGSYFWYDGAYFEIVDTVPSYWYDDPIYVVYDEACGCYYVVDPVYPGVRIHVGIRF